GPQQGIRQHGSRTPGTAGVAGVQGSSAGAMSYCDGSNQPILRSGGRDALCGRVRRERSQSAADQGVWRIVAAPPEDRPGRCRADRSLLPTGQTGPVAASAGRYQGTATAAGTSGSGATDARTGTEPPP